MTAPFRLEPLSSLHNRKLFECGEEALDHYFQRQLTQDIRRRIASGFVAVENATEQVAAFYTLASASILLTDLPADLLKRLPRYPVVPAVRIGRLAVDRRFHGHGLGGGLLVDALHRTLQAPPAAFALLVDAKSDQAVAFYQHHGFRFLTNQPRTLFLPLAVAEKTLLSSES